MNNKPNNGLWVILFSAVRHRIVPATAVTNRNRQSGAAALVLVLALGIASALGYTAYNVRKTFEPPKPTKEINELNQKAQEAEKAAKEAQVKLAEAVKARDDATAAALAKERSTAGFVVGTGMALDAEPNPSVNVRIAKTLNADAAKTLVAASPEQTKEFTEIIKELSASNATLSAKLAAKEAEATVLKTTADTAEKKAVDALTKAAVAEKTSADLSTDVANKANDLVAWANNHQTLIGRLKAIAIILVTLWLASLILPLLGKFFPAFQPLATAFGAIWSPGVQAVASGAKTLSADLVALHENVKSELAKDLNPAQIEALKTKVKNWWGNDHKSQHAIEEIKDRILRV